MPKKSYVTSVDKLPNKNAKIFQNGYVFVNETVAKVLQQYNLGQTQISCIYIYDLEGNKVSDIPYYFINLAEKRKFLVEEESTQLRKNCYAPELKLNYIKHPKNDDIAVLETAKDCDVDLWHDPHLRDSWFMSDRLATALIEAGVTPQKDVDLITCRLVKSQ